MSVCGRNSAEEYWSKNACDEDRSTYVMARYMSRASALISSERRHSLVPPREALPRNWKRSRGTSGRRPMTWALSMSMC